MERAEVMTVLRNGGNDRFPKSFEERVSENAKQVCAFIPVLRVHVMEESGSDNALMVLHI